MGGLLSKRSALFKSSTASSTPLQKPAEVAPVLPVESKPFKLKPQVVTCARKISTDGNSEEKLTVTQIVAGKEGLVVPDFKTGIKIVAISKAGHKDPVPIVPSSDPNKFYAIFDRDDVDFEIQINNRKLREREVGIRLDVHNRRKKFIVDRKSILNLRTFKSNGKQFHLIRQSGEDGQIFVGTFAQQNGLSFQEASLIVSQIKFGVEYSKPSFQEEETRPAHALMKLQVMQMNGKAVDVFMPVEATVGEFKSRIQDSIGILKDDQKLIFGGKLLQDEGMLEDCKLCDGSTVYVVQKVKGGGSSGLPFIQDYAKDLDLGQAEKIRSENDEGVGELGAVAFGDESGQYFQPASFEADEKIYVNDFTIEFRLKSKYSFAS